MKSMKEVPRRLRAGELAGMVGVSTDTLRYYERRGLLPLPERRENGYRDYARSAVDRVLLIRRALALGLTVDELGRLLRVRDRGGAPCVNARALLAEKLAQLDARLVELQDLRRVLRATLADWDSRLSRTATGARAGLLEAIAPPRAVPPTSASSTRRRRSS